MVGVSRIWKKKKMRSSRRTWTCVQASRVFTQQALSTVQSTAGCSTTFRPDLPLPLLHHSNTISTVVVLQAATQLEVMCLRFRVQRDVFLYIELRLPLTSPRLLLYSCTAVCSPITTKRPLVVEVVRPAAPTLCREVVRLAYLLRRNRPPHRHSA